METSDAVTQSVKVERCKYNHEWVKTQQTEEDDAEILCAVCRYRPKPESEAYKQAEAILHLREVLKPGDTVYTVLRHVSRSGMSRNIDVYYVAVKGSLLNECEAKPVWISAYVGHAIGSPQSRKNWERSQGLTVGGCGMDMGFSIVYVLSRTLFSKGFVCPGEKCPSNDHFNDPKCRRDTFKGQMHTGDGGYALRQEWL